MCSEKVPYMGKTTKKEKLVKVVAAIEAELCRGPQESWLQNEAQKALYFEAIARIEDRIDTAMLSERVTESTIQSLLTSCTLDLRDIERAMLENSLKTPPNFVRIEGWAVDLNDVCEWIAIVQLELAIHEGFRVYNELSDSTRYLLWI